MRRPQRKGGHFSFIHSMGYNIRAFIGCCCCCCSYGPKAERLQASNKRVAPLWVILETGICTQGSSPSPLSLPTRAHHDIFCTERRRVVC